MGGPLGTASGLRSADRLQRCEGIYRKEVTLTFILLGNARLRELKLNIEIDTKTISIV